MTSNLLAMVTRSHDLITRPCDNVLFSPLVRKRLFRESRKEATAFWRSKHQSKTIQRSRAEVQALEGGDACFKEMLEVISLSQTPGEIGGEKWGRAHPKQAVLKLWLSRLSISIIRLFPCHAEPLDLSCAEKNTPLSHCSASVDVWASTGVLRMTGLGFGAKVTSLTTATWWKWNDMDHPRVW